MLIPIPVVAIASAIAPARRDFLRIDPPVVVVVALYALMEDKPILFSDFS
jgi:hypothetical protein